LLCAATVFSLRIGSYSISFPEIFQALFENDQGVIGHVVRNIRFPRIFAALLAGACLGIAGTGMQNVLRNPLGSPFTLGISQGAAFGAAFAIIALGAGNMLASGDHAGVMSSPYVVVCAAFGGSLITVAALIVLSSIQRLSPAALILAGVALSSFFGAATMLLQYFASDIQVAATVFWTFGDLGKARWQELGLISIALIPASAWFAWRTWHFNAMLWGDDTARSLGVSPYRLRLVSLILAALISSVTTAFLGIIGFVGLIAPHMVRMIIGEDHRFLLPCSAMTGGLLLLVSDALARTVMAPIVLPVGIVTSFAGVPLFLYLLLTQKGI
jgi:iron complex transport system permease protein